MIHKYFMMFVIYIVSSLIFAFLFLILIPKRFTRKPSDLLLLFLLNLLLGPVFSVLSLILVIALHLQKPFTDVEKVKATIKDWEIEKRPIGERALSNNKIPTKAIYAILNNGDMRFMKTMKQALSSENDENRLLAFGYLQRIEQNYFDILKKLEEIYEKNKSLKIMKRIAITMWEMIIFDIVEEDIKNIYQQKCKEMLLELSEKLNGDESVLHVLGRIYLIEKDYEKAYYYLSKAFNLAVDRSKIMPYLLETLFYQKRFKDIKIYCNKYKMDRAFSINLISNNIMNFWYN